VYPLFMDREITRSNVREVIRARARGSARQLQDRGATLQHGNARLKRFLNFLRKHDCQIPFKEYR
jgi:hypothetical protein